MEARSSSTLARLRAYEAASDFEVKLQRLARHLETRYSPDQARVPAGTAVRAGNERAGEVFRKNSRWAETENDVAPAIGWSLNGRDFYTNAGPGLGFLAREKAEKLVPYECAELELYDSPPEDIHARYKDCILDFVDDELRE